MPMLRDHQYAGVAAALPALEKYGGFYLSWGVGSGKSLGAIAIARMLGARRILVVTGPLVAVGVWRQELAKWWPEVEAQWGRGNIPNMLLGHRAGVHGMNIDSINPVWFNQMVAWRPDLLIFDEAHYGKTPSAARTKKMWKLRDASRYFLALSGTPAHNVLDYWSQYRMIAPDDPLWSLKFGQYKHEVALWKGPHGQWYDRPKPRAQELIAQTIAPYTHWFDTRDLNLPEPIWTEVPVTLYPAERRAYDQMRKDFIADLPEGWRTSAKNALGKAMRLHQIASGHAVDTDGVDRWHPSAKLDRLLELLEDRKHLKVVVACKHLSEISEIAQAVVRRGVKEDVTNRVFTITGDVSAGERARISAIYSQRDAESATLILQPRSGGISIDLTAADCLINYSFEPSNIVWQQLVGRVWRMGQTGHVQILSLLAENTLDGDLYRGLRENMEEGDLAKYVVGRIVDAV